MPRITTLLFCTMGVLLPAALPAQEATWPGETTQWHGHRQHHFEVDGRKAWVVVPDQPLDGHPWIWRARFPGYHDEMDRIMVGKGFHLAYLDVAGLFGAPTAIDHGESFYRFVTERGLSALPVLEGVSRGGLFVYNWAARHPDRVAAIYCDTPVLDIKSWPGGKGTGLGSPPTWQQCLKAYGFAEPEALSWKGNPIDHAAILAKASIPILHIVSNNDQVVPPAENTAILKARLEEAGGALEVITVKEGTAQSNGHHFTHPDPDRVVTFMLKHGSRKNGKTTP